MYRLDFNGYYSSKVGGLKQVAHSYMLTESEDILALAWLLCVRDCIALHKKRELYTSLLGVVHEARAAVSGRGCHWRVAVLALEVLRDIARVAGADVLARGHVRAGGVRAALVGVGLAYVARCIKLSIKECRTPIRPMQLRPLLDSE